jgi:hypothetical protein
LGKVAQNLRYHPLESTFRKGGPKFFDIFALLILFIKNMFYKKSNFLAPPFLKVDSKGEKGGFS